MHPYNMNLQFNTNLFGDVEFISLAKVTTALAAVPRDLRDVELSGFNDHTGNVYIILECGVTICSAFGRDVEYYVWDDEKETDVEFSTFSLAYTYASIFLVNNE